MSTRLPQKSAPHPLPMSSDDDQNGWESGLESYSLSSFGFSVIASGGGLCSGWGRAILMRR
jgi:hypothetical protein